MKVRALKQLAFNTSRGLITVESGQTFKPADPQKLIDAGLAEPINKLIDPDDIESMFKILQMPLSQFKKGAYLIRVRCRYLNNEEVFIASSEREAAIGRAEGLTVYLPDELIQLVRSKATPAEVRAVYLVKQSLGGVLTSVTEIKESKPIKARKG